MTPSCGTLAYIPLSQRSGPWQHTQQIRSSPESAAPLVPAVTPSDRCIVKTTSTKAGPRQYWYNNEKTKVRAEGKRQFNKLILVHKDHNNVVERSK